MISCDSIIENNSLRLRNLNIGSTEYDTWSDGSSAYNTYIINYEKSLIKGHLYYFQCDYKYTTTNQRPTWVRIFSQNGSFGVKTRIDNPEPNTEYVLTGIIRCQSSATLTNGAVYNGPYSAINGVLGYVKNLFCYDVTDLYQALKANGVVGGNDNDMEIWCKENLHYVNNGVDYDVNDLVTPLNKISFSEGNLVGEPIECDGMEFYIANSDYKGRTYFDNEYSPLVRVYNNKSNGAVTITKVSAKENNSPFYNEHPYVLEIKTNGEASPQCGGIYTLYSAAANKVIIQKFVAKIPVGYEIYRVGNTPTDSLTTEWLTSIDGTGEWEEYAVLITYKSEGTFSQDGHIYLKPKTGYSATSVTWYLAYINVCDITGHQELKNYTALPNKDVIKGNQLFTREINTSNFITNGKCTDLGMSLPNGWEFDIDDVVGNAKASIVQNVNAAAGSVFGKIKINPTSKYKFSYWVKCKGDMSSFLTAISYYLKNGIQVSHNDVVYVPGTKTTLTQDLVSGDNQMIVSKNNNWVEKSFSCVGFRTYNCGYNDIGDFENKPAETGVISGVSGNTIVTFKTPYTGETIPTGTYVVESYHGGTYPYPIMKKQLPTDNTWKYVEGYFGNDTVWDGASSNGWLGAPADAEYIEIRLNLYTNNGTVPIKYCDFKLEEIGNNGNAERNENKIQFLKHN